MFLLLVCCIATTRAFITRLPDCDRYFANFTERKTGRYFENGTVSKRLTDISRLNCSLSCLFDDHCIFINHRIDNSSCELITSHTEGEMVDSHLWQFVSTDYLLAPRLRGPTCRFVSPLCNYDEICVDTCEAPGYKCVRWNVALGAETASSGQATKTRAPKFAVDGNIDTWYTSSLTQNRWIRVILGEIYMVEKVILYNVPNSKHRKHMRNINVRVIRQFCEKNINMANQMEKRVSCRPPRRGRLVIVEKITNDASESLVVAEIVVMVL